MFGRDGFAVANPRTDDVHRVFVSQLCLPRTTKVLEGFRSRIQTGTLDDAVQLRPRITRLVSNKAARWADTLGRISRAKARKAIFMIDASKGFRKDGPKNRLREQDIHRIIDTFTRQLEIPGYSRLVPVAEISDAKNGYNLNLPRDIDGAEAEDLQDITAHLRGGIPDRDIEAFDHYWQVIPGVRAALFKKSAWPGYSQLTETRACMALMCPGVATPSRSPNPKLGCRPRVENVDEATRVYSLPSSQPCQLATGSTFNSKAFSAPPVIHSPVMALL